MPIHKKKGGGTTPPLIITPRERVSINRALRDIENRIRAKVKIIPIKGGRHEQGK